MRVGTSHCSRSFNTLPEAMRSLLLSALLPGVALGGMFDDLLAGLPPLPDVPAPNICKADDLLNMFREVKLDAIHGCRQFLGVGVETTFVATVTAPAETATALETVTQTLTEVTTITDGTVTTTTTKVNTMIKGIVATETSTSTAEPLTLKLRARVTSVGTLDDVFNGGMPEPSLSSACSCLSAPKCVRKLTSTVPGGTSTLSATSTVDTTTTESTTTTDLVTETTMTTTTSTSTASTTTLVVSPPTPSLFKLSYSPDSDPSHKQYLTGTKFQQGNRVYLTSDATAAVAFQYDDDGHLTYNKDGNDWYCFYHPAYWPDQPGVGNFIPWSTKAAILDMQTSGPYDYFPLIIDLQHGTMSGTVGIGGKALFMYMCNGIIDTNSNMAPSIYAATSEINCQSLTFNVEFVYE
ncbi:hypothetical protein QBC47DRAFT_372392 [Echria macrotheca]|uniref:Uncharacterized protein n=1 Tax=Echria macrotheca TaxID=438768 RepID=A0AAJ0BJS6_9PEZI|nr:hypothetical protein QBC47DRAFT_372392 [Echria macrotheca]